MYPMRIAGIAAILVLAVTAASPMLSQRAPVGPIPTDCNRACLEGLINQYLDAVMTHDPKGLPLSADVKYTEQEQIMSVGDGFWKTVTGLSLQFIVGAGTEREIEAKETKTRSLFSCGTGHSS